MIPGIAFTPTFAVAAFLSSLISTKIETAKRIMVKQ